MLFAIYLAYSLVRDIINRTTNTNRIARLNLQAMHSLDIGMRTESEPTSQFMDRLSGCAYNESGLVRLNV